MTLFWRGVVVALASLVGVLPVGGTGAFAAGRPTASLSSSVLVPGQSVTIYISGFPLDTTVQAVLCGANGVDGTVDCAESAAATMSPGPGGDNNTPMQVVIPPKPCPCIVEVTAVQSFFSKRFPVTVVGAPTAPVVSQSPFVTPSVRVVNLRVTGGLSLGSAFGGPAARTLEVTVFNRGPSPVLYPVLASSWGRGGDVVHLIDSPAMGSIAPGTTVQIKAPFTLDALSFGNYDVVGRLTGPAIPVNFKTETSTWPVGLMAVLVIIILLICWRIARRIRQRRARKRCADTVAEPTAQQPTIAGPAPAELGQSDHGAVAKGLAPESAAQSSDGGR